MDFYLKLLKCLGDQTRIRILRLLMESKLELCVCEIVDSLQIPFYSISKHIKELKNTGILSESRNGTFIMYSIAKDENEFITKIIELIKTIPDENFSSDITLLKKRLAIRENGKCTIGLIKK